MHKVMPIIAPDSQNVFAIVVLYEDLEKNVSISDVIMSGVRTYFNAGMGGWKKADDPRVSKDLSKMLKQAMEGFTGGNYSPVAVVGTQAVSGTNYCIFCERGSATGNPESDYVFIYLCEDDDGNPYISDILGFNG